MRARLLPHPALSLTLALVWVALVNEIGPGSLVTGLVLGLVVPLVTQPFWPDRPRLRRPHRVLEYVLVAVLDIVAANLQVARLVLFRRNASLRSTYVTVPLALRSPEAITVLAATITLTPGTLSAELSADGRSLLVHALDVPDPDALVAGIKTRYEARLLEIFT
ncbi:Na+/H+ antiporter subunit E [Benzoatithermus flavus]|uniref:Na+/H+ antiporter subunit E n=1 Tax=Benzoatithermus flavus TaxID=3108223 RepID=A0ABU8XNW5_9PROT